MKANHLLKYSAKQNIINNIPIKRKHNRMMNVSKIEFLELGALSFPLIGNIIMLFSFQFIIKSQRNKDKDGKNNCI